MLLLFEFDDVDDDEDVVESTLPVAGAITAAAVAAVVDAASNTDCETERLTKSRRLLTSLTDRADAAVSRPTDGEGDAEFDVEVVVVVVVVVVVFVAIVVDRALRSDARCARTSSSSVMSCSNETPGGERSATTRTRAASRFSSALQCIVRWPKYHRTTATVTLASRGTVVVVAVESSSVAVAVVVVVVVVAAEVGAAVENVAERVPDVARIVAKRLMNDFCFIGGESVVPLGRDLAAAVVVADVDAVVRLDVSTAPLDAVRGRNV